MLGSVKTGYISLLVEKYMREWNKRVVEYLIRDVCKWKGKRILSVS